MVYAKVILFVTFFIVLCRQPQAVTSCNTDADCPGSQVCCNNFECHQSCLNQPCIVNSDCRGDGYCCEDMCQYSCAGSICDDDINCGAPGEYCCDGNCQNGTCDLAGWKIFLIFVAIIIFAVIIACLSVRLYGRRRPGLIVTGAPVVAASNVNYGSIHAQPPPSSCPPP